MKQIGIDFKKMEQFIFGKEVKDFEKTAKNIAEKLGFTVNAKQSTLNVPIRRSPDDINIPEDISEEVARIYGYDKITALPLISEVQNVEYTPLVDLTRKLEDIIARNLHFNQTETYPRIGEKTISLFGLDEKNLYGMLNPVNPELPYLRDDMAYGLLSHVIKNHKFFDEFRIFDIGKVWRKNEKLKMKNEKLDKEFAKDLVDEKTQLGMIIYQKAVRTWHEDPFLAGKSMVRTILKQLGLTQDIDFRSKENVNFHPKKYLTVMIGKTEI